MSAGIDTLRLPAEQAEFNRIRQNLGELRFGAKIRTSRKIAKAILGDGWWTWNGRFCEPVVEAVGLGLYDVSAKQFDPTP